MEFGARVMFRHPLVRSAAYQSAPLQERRQVHRALAEATDPESDPDRRAWHQAQAAPGPDEDVAGELERSAGRAQARGGVAAAAAFLERAAALTPEPARRAQRLLAAARAKRDAGGLDAALRLLVSVEAGPPDAWRAAEVEHLRGGIAMEQRRSRVGRSRCRPARVRTRPDGLWAVHRARAGRGSVQDRCGGTGPGRTGLAVGRTRFRPTEWALGIEARVRALLSDGDAADRHYRASIAHLDRTRVRAELARTHLLYGEWLRRQHRRTDAREQLRIAHEMLDAMGIEAFAARARHELRATGQSVGRRTVNAGTTLTTQETQVARLARDGLSNPEIGTRLLISPATVAYHLRKVFTKLGITSRGQLGGALPGEPAPPGHGSSGPTGSRTVTA